MHGPPSTTPSRDGDVKAPPRGGGRVRWRRRDHWCVTETILSINSRLEGAMQVSCCKLTVNDGKQMGGTTSHNRTVTWRYTVGNCVFRRLEKFFTLWPAYKSLPQLLGQDFVVNFATYTRVYTVYVYIVLRGAFDVLMGLCVSVASQSVTIRCLWLWHRSLYCVLGTLF